MRNLPLRRLLVVPLVLLVGTAGLGCTSDTEDEAAAPDAGATMDVSEFADADSTSDALVSPQDTPPPSDDTPPPSDDTAPALPDGCIPGCPQVGMQSCDSSGRLVQCQTDRNGCPDFVVVDACDDGDPCTDDGCSDLQCTHTPNDACGQPDAGNAPDTTPPAPQCTQASDCGSFETCLDGQCVEILAWSKGDTEEDTRLFFMIHAGICALVSAADKVGDNVGDQDSEPVLCFGLDPGELKLTLDTPSLTTWWCADPPTADDFLPYPPYSENEILGAASALLPCNEGSTSALTFPEGGLMSGPAGVTSCMYGEGGAVSVGPCP